LQAKSNIERLPVNNAFVSQFADYQVTKTGWKLLWVSISSKRHFEIPMISKLFNRSSHKTVTQPSVLGQGYGLVNRGLCAITRELAMI